MLKILKYLFLASIGVFVLLGLFIGPEHPHFLWEKIPVIKGIFDVIFGFVGCVVFVLIAILGHHLLEKDEDYYD